MKKKRQSHSRWVHPNTRYPLAKKEQILCPCGGSHFVRGQQRELLLAQIPQEKNWRKRYSEGYKWHRGARINPATRLLRKAS